MGAPLEVTNIRSERWLGTREAKIAGSLRAGKWNVETGAHSIEVCTHREGVALLLSLSFRLSSSDSLLYAQ